ncbi:TPA: TIGR03752 family integrating conjugative element protein [Salmonella enterica]|uniref:TIGR03752 family integrating conjugative element protein n=1 Tax=Salmonella enterica TaxID=28901 RepID=UPI0009B085E2|nr:TIGR03752 family integrating conjugative element protein [Salmonella enterica]HBD1844104.1 TIGR03752 family integrating conjugative element protein [Salmonella enterica]
MQIKSNTLVKILVPTVVAVGVLIGIKSCSSENAPAHSASTSNVLADLSPDELKALGVAGDTPEDTLKTLIGSYRTTRTEQAELKKQVDDVLKENERLRKVKTDIAGEVQSAVSQVRDEATKRQQQLQNEQQSLMDRIQTLTERLNSADSSPKGSDSDIPLGLGLDGMGGNSSSPATLGNDGFMWIGPQDQKAVDPRDAASGRASPQFPTSFLDDNMLTRQKAEYEQQVKGYSNEKAKYPVSPVYTLPENSTLIGSRAMTALLGRVPINGTVTDPYPFKVLIGKDNLTANGIELPDVEGAIVSGTASGDWTLSCVRGQVNSITFVFADGTVRTLPQSDVNGQSNGNGNGQNNSNSGIGWISDEDGIPCISGDRKSNASTYLPTIAILSAAGAAGEALSEGQYTTQNNVNGLSSTLTGDAGEAALGKALSGGMSATTDWVKQRYGQTFDAIYVPPGARLAVHITRQLAIDYEEKGRKVRYDEFELPGVASRNGGLD